VLCLWAILDWISNNETASTVVGGLILAGILGFRKWLRDREDSETIYKDLLGSKSTRAYNFRSTHAISSHTKIPKREWLSPVANIQRFGEMKKKKSRGRWSSKYLAGYIESNRPDDEGCKCEGEVGGS
jgi:hypothetical protein